MSSRETFRTTLSSYGRSGRVRVDVDLCRGDAATFDPEGEIQLWLGGRNHVDYVRLDPREAREIADNLRRAAYMLETGNTPSRPAPVEAPEEAVLLGSLTVGDRFRCAPCGTRVFTFMYHDKASHTVHAAYARGRTDYVFGDRRPVVVVERLPVRS